MSRYATLAQLKAYTGHDGTVDDALLQACLDRAEAAIDAYTRRQFVGTVGTVSISDRERHLVVGNTLWLRHDLYRLIALTLGDGQSVPVGSVVLEPREGPPYRALRLRQTYAWTWTTDGDIVVVGTYGYSMTPPDDIVQATIRYATYLYRQKDVTPTDVIGNPDTAQTTLPKGMPDDVKWLLAPYRSRSGGVV